MVYGATGSLNIPEIVDKIVAGQVSEAVLVFGVVFVVSGIAFKFGAVPFHMWMPDVYQGTATVATLLIAAGPEARGVRAGLPAAGRGADDRCPATGTRC